MKDEKKIEQNICHQVLYLTLVNLRVTATCLTITSFKQKKAVLPRVSCKKLSMEGR